ncbi:3,4-dihydroxy-2-butanone-4-phosphate synthase [Halorubrum sp. RMP-47]|uniref:3,4-dihydroxy-2-butanone 4-phosphate synthase n=1 Tax=Halorubrum miltondacostae TaxID=3076378 RepID=A0ABD5M4M9_9EURY
MRVDADADGRVAGEAGASADSTEAVERAINAFHQGEPVLVHDADDREGETDILYPAGAVTPADLARLRNDGGGLVFVALSDAVAEAFDLPFLHDLIDHPAGRFDGLGYDVRPSFSLTVNHRETYTGITDEDRALTVRALADAASDPESFDFAGEFRAPGHVHLLRGAPGLLAEREGHTELGLALAGAAERPPAVVGCEMLDDETGDALAPADAAAYAARRDIPYVEGTALVEALT